MNEVLVPDHLTPVHVRDVYAALWAAWQKQLGGTPLRNSVLLLLAHWSFETGAGKWMHCFNIGNIKHTPGDARNYCQFQAGEDDPAGKETLSVMSFRAYPDLASGCEDYMTVLRADFRYAWPAVAAGDPTDFCHRLKMARYYTAPEATYTRGVVGCMHYLDTLIPADPSLPVADFAQAGIEALMASFVPDHDPPPEAVG